MTYPSPLELGRVLNLSKDGAIVTHESNPDPTVIARLAAALCQTRDCIDATGSADISRAYKEEFLSLYLPSLIQQLTRPTPYKLSAIATASWMLSGPLHSVCRFIREQPNLILQAFDSLQQALFLLTSGLDNPSISVRPLRLQVCTLAECLGVLTYNLLRHLPCETPFPGPSPEDRFALRALSDRLEHDLLLRAQWEDISTMNLTSWNLLASLRWNSEGPVRRSLSQTTQIDIAASEVSWRHCEATVSLEPSEPALGACTKVEPGQEMMACGRCVAVRYCSRAHQKADWKRHKAFCFQPTW